MKIATTLTGEGVLVGSDVNTKEQCVQRLLAPLAPRVDADKAYQAVTARERQASTLISMGDLNVAIPHASTDGCRQLVIAVGVFPNGIPWNAGKTVHAVFLLLAPAQSHALYLRTLARLARLCEDAAFLRELLQAGTAEEVIAVFKRAESSLGEMATGEGMPTFCIAGAGHGGMAMAAHLSILGCQVNLFNRTADRIAPVQARGEIAVSGEIHGSARLNIVSADPAEALDNVDVVMIVVPATAHRSMGQLLGPHLKDGQIVVLNPGRTGGALELAKVVREVNPRVRPFLAEAQTLLYAARVVNPAQVHIYGIKNSVPLAAFPAYQTADILPTIRKALPQFVPGDNVLKTSLDNIGAIFHPAITVLNAGRIEDTHGDFEYYVQGVTPAVAAVLERLDAERIKVAAALGIRANTAREWLYLAYDAAGKTLLEAMRSNAGYCGIQAPQTIQNRYISEDVPASLVPIASIGEMLGVHCPTMRAMIHLASTMHGVDYWKEGRTVDRLGIQGMSVKEIRFLVVGADLPAVSIQAEAPSTTNPTGAGRS